MLKVNFNILVSLRLLVMNGATIVISKFRTSNNGLIKETQLDMKCEHNSIWPRKVHFLELSRDAGTTVPVQSLYSRDKRRKNSKDS